MSAISQSRDNGPVIVEGYKYHLNYRKQTRRYMTCSKRRVEGCFGRGVLYPDGHFELTRSHNHASDQNLELISIFKSELYKAVVNGTTSNRNIYDNLRVLHPEAAVAVPFVTIESSMQRWRKANRPPYPHSIKEYYQLLNSEQGSTLLEYNGGSVKCLYLKAGDDSEVLVFYDPIFIGLISDAREFNVDATFKCLPCNLNLPRSCQFLTVMATKFDHSLPFFWALMSRRTASTYQVIFQHLLEIAPHLGISSLMCDYERALYATLKEIFPQATVNGCFFHFCQAIYRHAKHLGLVRIIRDSEEAQALLRTLMALALVPSFRMEEAFQLIKQETPPNLQDTFSSMFQYVERTWLRQVTPNMFSVFNLLRRTNNSIESYHRAITQRFGVHPNVWIFTRELVKLQFRTHHDLLILQSGNRVTRTSKVRYLINSKNISRAWLDLESGRKTLKEFIDNAKYFVSTLTNNLIGTTTENIEDQNNQDFMLIEGSLQTTELDTVPEAMQTESDTAIVSQNPTATTINNETEHVQDETVPVAGGSRQIINDGNPGHVILPVQEHALPRRGRPLGARRGRPPGSSRGRPPGSRRGRPPGSSRGSLHNLESARSSRNHSRGRPRGRPRGRSRGGPYLQAVNIENRSTLTRNQDGSGGAASAVLEIPNISASPTMITANQQRYTEAEIMAIADSTLAHHHDEILATTTNTNESEDVVELLQVDRSNIIQDMFEFYTSPAVVTRRLKVEFKGESGSDFGGLTKEVFTVFWNAVQFNYFRGEDLLVPFLPLHRMFKDKSSFKLIGRILTHMKILTDTLPSKISRCTYALIGNPSADIPNDILLEDFKLFVTKQEAVLITKAVDCYNSLASTEISCLQSFFSAYGLFAVPNENEIFDQVLTLALDVLVNKPKEFVSIMRDGISEIHLETVWQNFTLTTIIEFMNKQKPSCEKIINCLTPSTEDLTNEENRVFYYLQQYIMSIGQDHDELAKFLLFVTGSVFMPSVINVSFNTLTGSNRRPIAHTCSNLLEVSIAYESFQDFRREFSLYLSSVYSFEYTQL